MVAGSIAGPYLSLAVIRLYMKAKNLTGVEMLLSNLKSYHCADPSRVSGAAPTAEEMRNKKVRKQYEKQQLEIQGVEEQLVSNIISGTSLKTMGVADDIDVLVTIALCVLFSTVCVLLLTVLLGVEVGYAPVSACVLLVGYTLVVLLKLDSFATNSRGRVELAVWLVSLALGAGVAWAVLMWAPMFKVSSGLGRDKVGLLNFDVEAAARGWDAIINNVRLQVEKRLDVPGKPWRTPARSVALFVCTVAGIMTTTLLGPGMQYARLLHAALNVPSWGAKYMQRGRLAIILMQLGFVLPVVVVLVQVGPVVTYVGLPASAQQTVMGSLLLAVALVHLLAITPLCQTYLDGALTDWYTLLHNGRVFEGKMMNVRLRLEYLRALLARAAMQLMSLSLVCLSLGLLMAVSGDMIHQLTDVTVLPRDWMLSKFSPALVTTLRAPFILTPGNANTALNMTVGVAPPAQLSLEEEGLTGFEDEGLFGLTEDGTALKTGLAAAKAAAALVVEAVMPEGRAEDVWLFMCQFIGWWACLVWSVVACASMAVRRLGLDGT
mmetsp:Transcript_19076/g.32690  ORF Transcript_19076/g.32690 Transcript_19076/m.32690 type:complete len:548 (+) Transcript_19076:130-1773(+)